MKSLKKREYGFDILRVIAMIYIIAFYHIDDYANDIFTNRFTTLLVYIALNTFFFISAYLLTNKYSNLTSIDSVKKFLINRVLRIYPLYFLSLSIFFFIGIVSFKEFFAGIFLINIFLDIYVKTLWFISLIFIYYILFSFIMYKYSFTKLICTYILITLILYFFHKYGFVSSKLFFYMPSFILGILFSKYENVRKMFSNRYVLITLLLLPILYVLMDIKVFPVSFIIVVVSTPFIFVISKNLIFKNNFILKLSYASFLMYLLHRIVFAILLQIYYPTSNFTIIAYLLIIGMPIIFVMSLYMQSKYDTLINNIVLKEK